MGYRDYAPPAPLLFGCDPDRDLPRDHLARLVEEVVEATLKPESKPISPGQPQYDPRLPVKALVYGYATGVRSSRQLERLCRESLPYLFLTRGAAPSYATLCTVRRTGEAWIEAVWVHLFAVAQEAGIERLGRITVDSTKLRANISPEAVLKQDEYEPVKQELVRILKEAEEADAREETEGAADTRTGKPLPREQMREILRRVRKRLARERRSSEPEPAAPALAEAPAPSEAGEPPALSARMLARVRLAVSTIEAAEAEGLKHACLTDPDARMMGEGREKRVRPCHSFEVAVDNGLLVAGQSTNDNTDNARLPVLVEAAKRHEPEGVRAVDADSGYFSGDTVGGYIAEGIDTCIPDTATACDLHRGLPIGSTRARTTGSVAFTYEEATDSYHCPEGNRLVLRQTRQDNGQLVKTYRAQRDCHECPLAASCLTQAKAKRRTLKVGRFQPILEAARKRFGEADHKERYHHRAEAVETVFGFIRATLGYGRWLLRGSEGVASEVRLMKTACQMRKVQRAWAAG